MTSENLNRSLGTDAARVLATSTVGDTSLEVDRALTDGGTTDQMLRDWLARETQDGYHLYVLAKRAFPLPEDILLEMVGQALIIDSEMPMAAVAERNDLTPAVTGRILFTSSGGVRLGETSSRGKKQVAVPTASSAVLKNPQTPLAQVRRVVEVAETLEEVATAVTRSAIHHPRYPLAMLARIYLQNSTLSDMAEPILEGSRSSEFLTWFATVEPELADLPQQLRLELAMDFPAGEEWDAPFVS